MIQLIINYLLILLEVFFIWFSFTTKETKKPADQLKSNKSFKEASAQTINSTCLDQKEKREETDNEVSAELNKNSQLNSELGQVELETVKTEYETKLKEMEKNLQEKIEELNLKCHEIQSLKSFRQNEANLTKQIDISENRITELEVLLSEKDSRFKHLETMSETLSKQLSQTKEELDEANNQKQQCENMFAAFKVCQEELIIKISAEHSQDMKNKLASERQQNEASLEALKKKLSEKETTLKKRESQFEEIMKNKLTTERQQNEAALEILNKRLSGKETEDKERQSQFEEVMKNKLAAERQQNEATLEALKKELSEKETELKRIELQFEEIIYDQKKKLDDSSKQIEQEKKKFESVKELNMMLIQTATQKKNELEKKTRNMANLAHHLQSVKDYASRLDEHYQKKKEEFNRINEENRELKNQINVQETELERLREQNKFHNQNRDQKRGQQRRNGPEK